MSRPAIAVAGLSKRYVIEHESQHDTLRDTLHHAARKLWRRFRWGTGFAKEEFWALRDVSFSVQPGEVVGIIGRNGAGKSTLLKILSRITESTSGKVTLRGRVASLLEVGTGFHPDLTGRENIFLNGAILGMRRAEIRRKFDEIVAFAEIERFLDTPVKRYSSGMYVRLAFAVAAHLEPEILIVDEVLAVGDAAFQKKCLGKMQDVAATQGRTVLLVSHNLSTISRLCTRAVLLEHGRVALSGTAAAAINAYVGLGGSVDAAGAIALAHEGWQKGAPLQLISLSLNEGRPIDNRRPFSAALRFRTTGFVIAGFGLGFANIDGRRVVTIESDYASRFHTVPAAGEHTVTLHMDVLDLTPGRYRIDVGAFGAAHQSFHYFPDCTVVDVQPSSDTPPHLLHSQGDWRPQCTWQLQS